MERIQEEHWIFDDATVNERAMLFPIAVRALFQRICLESRTFPFFMDFRGSFIYMQIDDIFGVVSWPNTLMGENWTNYRLTIGQEGDSRTASAIDFLKLDEAHGLISANNDFPYIIAFKDGQTFLCHVEDEENLPERLPAPEPAVAFDVYSNLFNTPRLFKIHNF